MGKRQMSLIICIEMWIPTMFIQIDEQRAMSSFVENHKLYANFFSNQQIICIFDLRPIVISYGYERKAILKSKNTCRYPETN